MSMAGLNAGASPAWNEPTTSGRSPRERSMRLRQLKPKELGDNGSLKAQSQKVHTKQPRSYSGCVSCKQRRIKCDETKPFCQQCARRKVVCRGYVRRIKWIDAGTQQDASGTSSGNDPTELFAGADIGAVLWTIDNLDQEGTDGRRETPASAALVASQDEDECLADDVTDPFVHYKPMAEPNKRIPRRRSHQACPLGKAMGSAIQNPSALYQQPQFSAASPENIAVLYHRHASDILSIRDSAATNPWQTRIWPLAKENKALYHALAAMTCLYMSKAQPELRVHGVMHAQESLERLVRDIQSGPVCEEAAIASGLALGFGDTFDHKAGSTSFQHTVSVKSLLQRLINQQQQPTVSQRDTDMICFLAGNWMYMDIIARFTSDSDAGVPDYDLWNTCVCLQRSYDAYQLDPLMGCATGLFSDLGRVANLVRRVRSTDSSSNSVAIVSAAAHVRARIEQWIPTISLSSVAQHDSNVPDALQTAEAYRWAALLLLRQAVPELPWLMSLEDMAQKVLVLLATISHSSRTVVIHILPLTIAGCEATSSEDRTWVRERWLTMSRRMLTAIVDKCLEVTEEVWKRRDFDLQDDGPLSTLTHTPDGDSGTKFTVKSKLHWMRVMKDWDWEVMLG